MLNPISIAIAANPPAYQDRIAAVLATADAHVAVRCAAPDRDGWAQLTRDPADICIVSASLFPDNVQEHVAQLRRAPSSPWAIVVTSRDDPDERAALLAAGCREVLYSGISDDGLGAVLAALIAERRRSAEHPVSADGQVRPSPAPLSPAPALQDFASKSPSVRALIESVEKLIPADTTLLLLGETGAGKERLARAIHAAGPRTKGPFIAVNCGGLPETLLESELFGHEKGAFTGASQTRRGCFELAHKGTIFLDEVGEMPPHFQIKLLRVLEERRVRRVGGEKDFEVDVRVISATNQDLAKAVDAKQFRSDLYYRLSVVSLAIPPLRERKEDLLDLLQMFIQRFSAQLGREVAGVSEPALTALNAYPWPGNIRELMNVAERAVLFATGPEITLDNLPPHIAAPGTSAGADAGSASSRLLRTIAEVPGELPQAVLDKPLAELRQTVVAKLERGYLQGLLRATEGRLAETAQLAGIEPRTLYNLMRKYDLHKEEFKQ
jgi:DNA-binding NtrC family response regulator